MVSPKQVRRHFDTLYRAFPAIATTRAQVAAQARCFSKAVRGFTPHECDDLVSEVASIAMTVPVEKQKTLFFFCLVYARKRMIRDKRRARSRQAAFASIFTEETEEIGGYPLPLDKLVAIHPEAVDYVRLRLEGYSQAAILGNPTRGIPSMLPHWNSHPRTWTEWPKNRSPLDKIRKLLGEGFESL